MSFYVVYLSAVFFYFLIGQLWFSEFAFGPYWRKECGLSKELMDRTPLKIRRRNIIVSFFISALIVGSVFTLRSHLSHLNFMEWLRVVLVLSGALVGCGQLRGYLYQKRSLYLFLIEAGYHYICILLVGAFVACVR